MAFEVGLQFIIKSFQFLEFLKKLRPSNTGMGKHTRTIDDDIPEPDFKIRLKNIGDALSDSLRSIDIQTNWSARNFTPLDAEVEVITNDGRRKRKINDLHKALRKSSDRLFLILGDPGSGKSVALRKLCQDLTKEIKKTGKIPIYVNLKEWSTQRIWSEIDPPTLDELSTFIKNNITERDIVIGKFFEKYYDRLYESGRLFFVLDSFDEIPIILDEKENSELIKIISELFFRFLKGARSDQSQGILASRIFRRPTQHFQTKTTLEIRPFSEDKIIETLQKSGSYNQELILKLFKDREDLVPVVRNPFSISLLADFTEYNDRLPKNQSELFESYINHTLISSKNKIEKLKLSYETIFHNILEIAFVMYEGNFGFEIPINELEKRLPHLSIHETIEVLKFCRLGRIGHGDFNLFSFSHRRFCEYFTVKKLQKANHKIDYETIPNDSQWRDALVLYCEVAELNDATQIANYCWSKIQSFQNTITIEVIHCLRFLNDAFKGRIDCIKNFRDDLGDFIIENLDPKKNMISVKFAVETIGLLDDDRKQKAVLKALKIKNEWISELAFKSCRHFKSLKNVLEKEVTSYINNLDVFYFVSVWRQLVFSLSLSNGLNSVKTIVYLRIFNIFLISISIIFLIFILPFILPILLFTGFFGYMIDVIVGMLWKSKNVEDDSNKYLIVSTFLIVVISILFIIILSILFDASDIQILNYGIFSLFNISNFAKYYIVLIFFIMLLISTISLNRIFSVKHEEWDAFSLTFAFFGLIVVGLVVYTFVKLVSLIPTGFNYSLYCAFILFSIFGIQFFRSLFNIYKCHIIYNDIIKKKLNKREYIFECFNNLAKSPYFVNKLVTFIENNVFEVEGFWPNSNFLNAKSERIKIRLAKLDLKWLGLNT